MPLAVRRTPVDPDAGPPDLGSFGDLPDSGAAAPRAAGTAIGGGFDALPPARPSAATAPAAPARTPIGQQFRESGQDVVHAIEHPWQTIAGIGKSAADAAYAAFAAPVVGSQRAASDYLRGKGIDLPGVAAPGQTITRQNTPGAVSPATMRRGALNTVANVGFASAPAMGALTRLPVNAGVGALLNPEEPVRGAVGATLLGEGVHGAFKLPRAIGAGIDRAINVVPADLMESVVTDPALRAQLAEPPDAAQAGLPFRAGTTRGKALARAEEIANRPAPLGAPLGSFADLPDAAPQPSGVKFTDRRAASAMPPERPILSPAEATAQPNRLTLPAARTSSGPLVPPGSAPEPAVGPLLDRFGVPMEESPNVPTGVYDAVGIRRRPLAELPISQRPPVEPPPDAQTQSFGGRVGRRVLTGTELGDATVSTPDLRERARTYAYENLRGNTYQNAETDTPIQVNRRGIDHTLRHAQDDVLGRIHAQSVPALDHLLEDATLVGSEPPKQNAGTERGTVAVHRFEKPVTIAGTDYTAHLVVKEAPDGHFFYDHRLTTIEPTPSSPAPFPQSQEGGGQGNRAGSTPESSQAAAALSSRPAAPPIEPPLNAHTISVGGLPPATLRPLVSSNSQFEARPGILRRVNAELGVEGGATPTPASLAPQPDVTGTRSFVAKEVTPVARSGSPAPSTPRTPEPRPSDILNVAKLNLADKTAEQRVANTVEQFRAMREQQRQPFSEADIDRKQIVNELTAGNPMALSPGAAAKLSGVELLARRDVVSQNDALIGQLSKSIESGQLSATEHEQASQLMQTAVEHNDALLSDLVTGSSQKGRDLNLLRRMAITDLDPATFLVQAKRMLGDTPMTDAVMSDIRRLVNAAKEVCGG